MIDISLYITKLDILQEYMRLLIDGKMRLTINLETLPIPTMSADQILGIFYQTGIMFLKNHESQYPAMKPTTFEEYYNWKINQQS